jgi:ribosomal protein S18 acetylase RimI-like enzyme
MPQSSPIASAQATPSGLRCATAADSAALALLGGATFLETYAGLLPGAQMVAHCARHHTETAWRALLAQKGAACWLIEAQGGAPVGYALLTTPDLPGQQPGDAELRRIYLLSRWRGRGLGAALMATAMQKAAAQGATRLLLGVWSQNEKALGFYRSQGFVPAGARRFQMGSLWCDDLVLVSRL